MDRMVEGRAHQREIDMLWELTKEIEGHTICVRSSSPSFSVGEKELIRGLGGTGSRGCGGLANVCSHSSSSSSLYSRTNVKEDAYARSQGLLRHFRPEVEARIRRYNEQNGNVLFGGTLERDVRPISSSLSYGEVDYDEKERESSCNLTWPIPRTWPLIFRPASAAGPPPPKIARLDTKRSDERGRERGTLLVSLWRRPRLGEHFSSL